MTYQSIKTLKGMVRSILEDVPATRNSDITLMIEVWKRFYPQRVFISALNNYEGIRLSDLYDLPREDNIKRVRAQFQNVKKLYLPTDLKIAQRRGIKEDDWRVAMGYPTKESTGTPTPMYQPPSEPKKEIGVNESLF